MLRTKLCFVFCSIIRLYFISGLILDRSVCAHGHHMMSFLGSVMLSAQDCFLDQLIKSYLCTRTKKIKVPRINVYCSVISESK